MTGLAVWRKFQKLLLCCMFLSKTLHNDVSVSRNVPVATKNDEFTTKTDFRFPKTSLKTGFFTIFRGGIFTMSHPPYKTVIISEILYRNLVPATVDSQKPWRTYDTDSWGVGSTDSVKITNTLNLTHRGLTSTTNKHD
jgi:hypothetical protein